MKLLAIDSGLQRCGYALFEQDDDIRLLDYGCIETKKTDALIKRFGLLYKEIDKLLNTYQPAHIVIEQLFFTKNQKTAITIAQTQGVVMTLAVLKQIPVSFVTPLQIKQCVTGYGRADKKQVQKMIMMLLQLPSMPKYDDTTDAIACGLAYCQLSKFSEHINTNSHK